MADKTRHGKAGLRQRLSQILLHSSCTTTSATDFVSLAKTNAAPANAAGSRLAPPPAAAHERWPKKDCSVRRRRRALVHISIDCAGATSARHSARSVGAAVLPSRSNMARHGKPRLPSYSCSPSTATDYELPPFSSDGEGGEGAETTRSTLFSSLSFSSDSTSDLYHNTSGSKRHKNPPPRRVPKRAPPRGAKAADALRPAVPAVEAAKRHNKEARKADGKVHAAGSMAVVKRSLNPYADFRTSMVEMVLVRRICGADAMSDLLMSYLSLNSRRHHPAILAAFEDVWEAIFGTP
ncbi:hypothetical protein GUJ93_ZPchr0010g8134 [Zizania palustris]|uniref:Transcription repressor n=1 Tax=Zizania palustris TaxID=103762 RepID=A0A8J6BG11_ZIZPA|nr:hypothetical protein GUJ93_ZPchr0010g8134 [Zizania palustris]